MDKLKEKSGEGPSRSGVGDYFVVVVTGLDALDWMEATKLEMLSRRAQRVTIGEGGKASIAGSILP